MTENTSEDELLLANMRKLHEELLGALGRNEMKVKLELPTLAWLALVEEIMDRRPRNYSRLIRDDSIERMNAVIDRLHDELVLLIANRPSDVHQ